MLPEEFRAPVKIDGEAMLRRFLFLRPLVGRQCVESRRAGIPSPRIADREKPTLNDRA